MKFEPLPEIEGGWKVIEADPPWRFKTFGVPKDIQKSRAIERHYPTMVYQDILDLGQEVKRVAAKDSFLWLWITGPFLMHATEVMHSWGYKFSSSGLIWVKLRKGMNADQYQLMTLAELHKLLHIGLGYTTRKNVEFCLLGRRGHPKRVARDVHEVIIAPVREHSRKPDESFSRIERYSEGPRLEMFSRQKREGWTVWGNQTDKWEAR